MKMMYGVNTIKKEKNMKVLVVVDMQNDFISGSLGSEAAQAILPNVVKKVQDYQNNGYDIIRTFDTHYEDYMETYEGKCLPIPHCTYLNEGWHYPDELENLLYDAKAIHKSTYGYTEWKKYFKNAPEVIELCGICSEICVITNALMLRSYYPETEIRVDSSCCAGLTPERHNAALEVMRSCNITII